MNDDSLAWVRGTEAPRRVAVSKQRVVPEFSVANGFAWYASYPYGQPTHGTLTRVSLETGTSTTVAHGLNEPTAVGVAGGELFWWSAADTTLRRLSIDSLKPPGESIFATKSGAALDGACLDPSSPCHDTAGSKGVGYGYPVRFEWIDDESIRFRDRLGYLFRFDRSSRTTTQDPSDVVTLFDAKYVYVARHGGIIERRPKQGGQFTVLVREKKPPGMLELPREIFDMTLGGGRLFWTVRKSENSSFTLYRAITLPP